MINLGLKRPGSTIRIPLESFKSDTGASFTATGLTSSVVKIYKNGNLTERASSSGITTSIDFDSRTGLHYVVIDLTDNTDAGFYTAGAEYHVVIDSVVVDTITLRFWGASFSIGYPGAVYDTTIQTLTSQTIFTLATGPAEAGALVGQQLIFHNATSSLQIGFGVVSAYSVTTKQVTLYAAPTFTIAVGDNVSVMPTLPISTSTTTLISDFRTDFERSGGLLDLTKTATTGIKTKTDQLNFTGGNLLQVDLVDWKGATAPAMSGDAFARLGSPVGASISADIASALAAITGLNNLSALANLYGPPIMEIPDSGSTVYAFTYVVRDNEGKLVDLDANPTITAANAAGTDRSSNLSAITHPAAGRYTFTYTVASTATKESLRIVASGTIGAEARYIEWIGAVVDYDSVTTLAAIKAKTDQMTFTVTNVLDANALRIGGVAQTGRDIGSSVLLAASQTFNMTGNITGNLSGSVGSVSGNVAGSVGSVTGSVGSVVGAIAQTGDSFARLGAPVGVSISADVAGINIHTTNLPTSSTITDNETALASPIGTVAVGTITTSGFTATGSLSTIASFYNGGRIKWRPGATNYGCPARTINSWSATKVLSVSSAWPTLPVAGDQFVILG